MIPYLYEKIRKAMDESSIDGTLSFSDCNEIMSWIRISKKESMTILKEISGMNMIVIGKRGIRLTIEENKCRGLKHD